MPRALLAVLALATAVLLVRNAVSPGEDVLFAHGLYNAVMVGAAVACALAARGRSGRERTGVLLLAASLASWAVAEVLWSSLYAGSAEPPYPSVCDAFWLAWAPLAYVGFVLLVGPPRGRAPWLDGAIAATAIGALGAAVVVPVARDVEGSVAQVATNLAYPVLDVVLLALVGSALVASGRRVDRRVLLVAAALAVGAVADLTYFAQSLRGTYVEGGVLDVGWPVAALLTAWAAGLRGRDADGRRTSPWRTLVVPAAAGAVVIGLLVVEHVASLPTLAFAAALASLGLLVVRCCWTVAENAAVLATSEREALEDALTGLGNRRALERDLARAVEEAIADPGRGRLLLLFDLDGFKHYNDTFGHPAGDRLLARLGGKLAAACAPHGSAYRMGGDEFCAVLHVGEAGDDALRALATAALAERGDTFVIGASCGAVRLGPAVPGVEVALQLADARLYESKSTARVGARRQARDVLLATLSEREPELHEHLQGTAALAADVAAALGLDAEARDEVARAAELHDVGKVAIPEAILRKPAAITPSERTFMEEHTVIGERILAAAPALRPVGRIVRSSHERWDGEGYPDGLAGEEIPLGARIVAVCDAFDAMVSDRPYRRGRPASEALEELRRCAGGQFDPAVVEAFCAVMAAQPVEGDRGVIRATAIPS